MQTEKGLVSLIKSSYKLMKIKKKRSHSLYQAPEATIKIIQCLVQVISFGIVVQQGPIDSQTLQAIVIALGYPSELDSKILLQEK